MSGGERGGREVQEVHEVQGMRRGATEGAPAVERHAPSAGPGAAGATGDVAAAGLRPESLLVYVLLGAYLGTIFIKSEVASWFRIQEMFRFQAFHMYGVIGSAVAVAAVGILLMRRSGARTVRGEPIAFPDRALAKPRVQHILGGTAFGLGWGLLGACPGPMFALLGAGITVMAVGLLGAVAGAWTYGALKSRLPHG